MADPVKRMRKRSISFSKMNTVELYVPGEQLEIKNPAPAPNPQYQTSSSVAFDKKVCGVCSVTWCCSPCPSPYILVSCH